MRGSRHGPVEMLGEHDRTRVGSLVALLPATADIAELSGGLGGSCALLRDRTVLCSPLNGQLTSRGVGLRGRAVQVSAGREFSCAVIVDGTAQCWGVEPFGQLGDGPGPSAPPGEPVVVAGLSGVTSLSAGGFLACAVLKDTTARCWGYNESGALGNNSLVSSPVPVTVAGLTGAVSVAVGLNHACALLQDGTVRCWGAAAPGGLGLRPPFSRIPEVVAGVTGAVAISAGVYQTCALLVAGRVSCWGDWTIASPSTDLGIAAATEISVGSAHSCALLADGTMRCWGDNSHLELGTPTTPDENASAVPVMPAVPAVRQPDDAGRLASTMLPAPARVLETRAGQMPTIDGRDSAIGERPAGSVTRLTIAGRAGVPADASAAVLTVTVVSPRGSGFLTVWSCAVDRPVSSNVNYVIGQTIANSVVVALADADVCIYTQAPTQLAVDEDGYYPAESWYHPTVPTRVLESRVDVPPTVDRVASGLGRRRAGSVTELPLAGRALGLPPGAAVVLNVTVVDPSAAGFVTVWPCGSDRPNASSLNFAAGQTIANLVVTTPGSGGGVCLYTQQDTDLIADLEGYAPFVSGLRTLVPGRLLDTRVGEQPTNDGVTSAIGERAAGSVTALPVTGRGGLPGDPSAVVLTVTVTRPVSAGHVTVWPCGQVKPHSSNVNFAAGDTVAGTVFTSPGDGGAVCIYTQAAADLVVDVDGYEL